MKLKTLMDAKDLWVELRPGRPSAMVLRGTYGQKVAETFHMSRQGVRWRFWHLFNERYVSAFETVLFVEKVFGPELRDYALRISRERFAAYQASHVVNFQSADTLLEASAGGSRRERTNQD